MQGIMWITCRILQCTWICLYFRALGYNRCYPAIHTLQRECTVARISTYNFCIPPTDRASASPRHLKTVHLCQYHGYKLNVSVVAIMAHKVSGCWRYSTHVHRLLTSSEHIGGLEDLRGLQDLVDACAWTDHVANLMLDSTWWVVCITNEEFALYHNLAAPIEGPHNLGDDDDSNDRVAWHHHHQGLMWGLVWKRPIPKHTPFNYAHHLCMFRCPAWIDGPSPQHNLAAMALCYFHQLWHSLKDFQSVDKFPDLTQDALGSVETMLSAGFKIYSQEDNKICDWAAWLLHRHSPGIACIIDIHLEGDQHLMVIGTRWRMLGPTSISTAVINGPALHYCSAMRWHAEGPVAMATRVVPMNHIQGSITYWVAWASSWPWNIGITETGQCLTQRHAWCDPLLTLGGPSQACMSSCPSLWRIMCQDMRGHTVSSPRALPRDWWTTCWLACGGCRTLTITWCRIPWTLISLSLTPWPFAKAERLSGPWGLWGCWDHGGPLDCHGHGSSSPS